MQPSEERELIRLARTDPEVFASIYDHYYPKIFEYALKRTANLQIAQDVTSETFFKALKKLWQFQWRNVPFSAWLYRIATNEANQYFRKRKYNAASLDELRELGFEPVLENNPQSELIEAQERLNQHQDFLAAQKAISQMSIKYQEVLCLRFFERKEIREISEILGKSEGTIKSLLHRGMEKLRSEMSGRGKMQPLTPLRIVEVGQRETAKAIEPN